VITKHYNIFETRFGWIGLTGSTAGVSQVILPQQSPDDVLILINATNARQDKNAFSDLIQRLMRYFNGEIIQFMDQLDLSKATTFEKLVWQAARQIPRGQTRSYGWIAKRIGKPNAARAVGQALGRNPIPILIPCHRVISSNGELGGFTGGIDIKQTLLNLEKKQ
jgi:methylated-DNA-[protein]-cysteine S-methyltransferase